MKKKTQVRNLILIIVAFVLLICGYLVLMKSTATDDTEEETEDSFVVTTVEESDIQKIIYTIDDTEIELDLKGEEWVTPTDETCPVNEYTVDAMLSVLKEVKATRKIKKKDIDVESFGLEVPEKVIHFTLKDGTEMTYTLGALNSVVDKYYFQMSGDENVYMIDTTMYNTFDYDLLELAEVEEYPSIGNQDIADFLVTMDGKTLYFVDAKDAAHKKNDSEIPKCVWKYGEDKDNLKKVDSTYAEELIQAIIGLTNAECVTYNKTEKDVKKCGLDQPSMTLVVNYTKMQTSETEETEDSTEVADAEIIDESYTVYVGGVDEESGEYYVNMEGSDAIYTMNVANIDTIKKVFE